MKGGEEGKERGEGGANGWESKEKYVSGRVDHWIMHCVSMIDFFFSLAF